MNENSRQSLENPIWDVAKLIMSFLVVCVHTGAGFPNENVNFFLEQWAARFAVPLFFCLAGYFLFSKTERGERLTPPDADTVKKYWLRILRMYVLWTCVTIVVNALNWISSRACARDILLFFTDSVLRGHSMYHFWYLSSLMVAVFLLWILHRFMSLRTIWAIALVFFLFGLIWQPHFYLVRGAVNAVLSGLYDFLCRVFESPRDGLCFALVFVTLGARLGTGEIRPCLSKSVWFFAALFCALSFVEMWWLRLQNNGDIATYGALQFSLLPAAYFIYSALVRIRMAPRPVYRTLRKCSTLIYCIHPYILSVFDRLPFGMLKRGAASYGLLWVCVFAVSFFVSLVWIRLEKNPKMRFLKMMH